MLIFEWNFLNKNPKTFLIRHDENRCSILILLIKIVVTSFFLTYLQTSIWFDKNNILILHDSLKLLYLSISSTKTFFDPRTIQNI